MGSIYLELKKREIRVSVLTFQDKNIQAESLQLNARGQQSIVTSHDTWTLNSKLQNSISNVNTWGK